MFIISGDSETRKGLGQKKQQESPGGAASLSGTSENGGRCRGLAQDKLLLPVAPLVASLLGTLGFRRYVLVGEEEEGKKG